MNHRITYYPSEKSIFPVFLLLLVVGTSCTKNHRNHLRSFVSGDVCTTSQIPVEDFFRNPEKTSFSISPDGSFVSYLAPYHNRLNIFVEPADGGKPVRITDDTTRDIRIYRWINNRQLVYLQDVGGNEDYKLFATDFEGKNNRCLTDFPGVQVNLLDPLDNSYDEILITMNQRDRHFFDAYRLNVNTGELKMVAENPGNVSSWLPDHNGDVRVAVATDHVNTSLLYRPTVNDPFKPVITTCFKETIEPLFFSFDNKTLYALSNINRDKTAAVKIDLNTGHELEVIYEQADYDINGMAYSRKRHTLTEVRYISWKYERQVLDDATNRLYDKISSKLDTKGHEFYLACNNDNEDRYIVRTYSDKDLGAYYYYDVKKDKLRKIADVAPWLEPENMAAMKPIEYTTRDGMVIHGYLTIPKGKDPKNLPVVVNPHGGPWYRNFWGFNPEVQFLANRGYAVLQMNFRGSTGYGKAFWQASFKEWGGKMQDDITDGVQWLIDAGIADKDRIAIYGASYGGYATLCGLTQTPDLYACGIDYVGVSNIFTFMKSIPPYWLPYMDMMHEMVGDPVKDSLLFVDHSPYYHVDRIKAPVLIVQGANDPRVNKNESDQMVKALRDRGMEVEYIVKNNEGHGFSNEENRMEFYRKMEEFLGRHLGEELLVKN